MKEVWLVERYNDVSSYMLSSVLSDHSYTAKYPNIVRATALTIFCNYHHFMQLQKKTTGRDQAHSGCGFWCGAILCAFCDDGDYESDIEGGVAPTDK